MDMRVIPAKTKVRLKADTFNSLVYHVLQLIYEFLYFFAVYPCDSSPCENNGTCVHTKSTFKWTCTEKYEGNSCENKGCLLKFSLLMLLKSSVAISLR